ncbi:SDR family oxidoreductase [Alphaproteobacteria bacterium GH1-50]|uniref:SDR family oxidoreductase n=1 Tax=Kangsaoukella pontilimi TaxID=2691042 RepID=A0A7C9IRB2_9RHOB|nr:SDR family oxidoreductase [Kangsaoukella pontilimi]MXQ07326.1 SDR family oxidoreductase [Kangsaoukella pontilimi]
MRHAVITGAASGIGAAAARALHERGYRITAIDLNDPGSAADRWIEQDLGDPDTPLPVIDGPVDALINAAGLPPRAGLEPKILSVNVLALRRVTRAVLPLMSEGGSIVNVASKAGAKWRENIAQVRHLLAMPDDADLTAFVADERIDPVRAYDLSKEAVIVWTKAATGDLIDRGIRMNAVSPAAVATPILDDFTRAFGERATRGIEMTRRSGSPEEVAEVIAFLTSPASEWVRGCNIETDGGLTAMLETRDIIGPDVGTP